MLKLMSLMKRRDDMSLEEFRNWATQEHPPLAKQLPGLRGYRMNVALQDNPDAPYDAVSEMWFDDDEARLAAFGSDAGKAAGGDAAGHCSSRFHLLSSEHIFI
ncbi:MAG: EthD family reductase [Alphaproteobacteria bacterium]